MRSVTTIGSLLLLSAFTFGCGSTANPDPVEEPEKGPDMFACGVPQDCTQDTGHLGSISDEELRCGGELIASQEAGAVLVLSQPGPYPTEIETLVVLLGDGTALQQIRSRCTVEDGCDAQNTTEWTLQPIQLCDVTTESDNIAGCGDPDGDCAWAAYGQNCSFAPETWSCDALP